MASGPITPSSSRCRRWTNSASPEGSRSRAFTASPGRRSGRFPRHDDIAARLRPHPINLEFRYRLRQGGAHRAAFPHGRWRAARCRSCRRLCARLELGPEWSLTRSIGSRSGGGLAGGTRRDRQSPVGGGGTAGLPGEFSAVAGGAGAGAEGASSVPAAQAAEPGIGTGRNRHRREGARISNGRGRNRPRSGP